jgi:hypothetical protein
MMKCVVSIWLALLAVGAMANGLGADTAFRAEKRFLEARRIEVAPKMDGVLDDEVWKGVPIATNFIQNSPYPGNAASQKTEVKVVYDNTALYIGATLYDVSNDSIIRQYSQRDNEDNTDVFCFFVDTYDDDQNAFGFVVHPTGVQWDARYSQNGQDISWNAVWISEISIDEKNWYVEMKIPYSAIRFPKKDVQQWGINFARKIRRIREFNFWNPVDPAVNGIVNQFGELTGVSNIESPFRLSFSPYVSAYLEHYPYNIDGQSNYSRSFNGGMDVKYGINDAFTLDMTLIPDFGQTQSDNQVLNLSPFEVRFNENRQFFTEGTELFQKGGLFYSRRIGGTPIDFGRPYDELDDDEEVADNPSVSQLLNASKVSGRTKGGLGIGIFNGVTKPMYATIENTLTGAKREVLTDPLTNYNVLVLDQNLKNNSSVTLINTNVLRSGHYYDANVTGLRFNLNNKTNMWSIGGGGTYNQKTGVDVDPDVASGHSFGIEAGKSSGNFQFSAEYFEESDTYDPNDLGFLYNNNSRNLGIDFSYNTYKPFWKFINTWSSISMYRSWLYEPNEFNDFNISFETSGVFRNFLATGIWFTTEPEETYDFFEPRVWGRFYTWETSNNIGMFLSSDYRKRFALDIQTNYRHFDQNTAEGRYRLNFTISPRFRFNDRFSMIYRLQRNFFKLDEGAAIDLNGSGTILANNDIIFGKRDQTTFTNTLSASYIFTNRMGLTFRLRHYWAKVDYKSFHVLDEGGYLTDSDYTGLDGDNESLHNTSFNAFNIDMVYKWVFKPGSEISVVWKNSIFTFDNDVAQTYVENLEKTLNSPQTNSFSIKVLYYIDYLYLKKK